MCFEANRASQFENEYIHFVSTEKSWKDSKISSKVQVMFIGLELGAVCEFNAML